MKPVRLAMHSANRAALKKREKLKNLGLAGRICSLIRCDISPCDAHSMMATVWLQAAEAKVADAEAKVRLAAFGRFFGNASRFERAVRKKARRGADPECLP
jgi:hypothetical protein